MTDQERSQQAKRENVGIKENGNCGRFKMDIVENGKMKIMENKNCGKLKLWKMEIVEN